MVHGVGLWMHVSVIVKRPVCSIEDEANGAVFRTPIGQAIGLATHTLYAPDSEFGLILVGTMNAISSGLLVFAALIELLAEDFLSDDSWATLRGRKRVAACFLVLFGAICMSLVGAWA